MGNKSQRSSSVAPQSVKSTEAFIYYLNRSESEVYLLKDLKIEKKSFSKMHRFAKDSALGYLTEQSLMTVGGTSRSGSLKKSSFIIDMDQMFIRNISPAPVKCKLGSLHSFRSFMYFTSGLRRTDDLSLGSDFLSLPLMRYKLLENYWEVFDGHEFIRRFNYNNSNYNFPIDSLMESGSFIYLNKLFIFAGLYLTSEPNLEVFSFDLLSESTFIKEKIRLESPLYSPICISNYNKVIIYGGRTENSANTKIFEFSSNFSLVEGKSLETSENHPGKLSQTYIIQVAFPRFALKSADSTDWTLFNLTGSNFGISAVTSTQKDLRNRGGLPPATPRGRIAKGVKNDFVSGQEKRVQSPTLHISYLTVQEKSDGLRNNSPTNRIREKFNEKLEMSNEEIIDKDNDVLFKVNKRVAVKVISLIITKMDRIELNALGINAISNSLGIVKEVSIEEIAVYLMNSFRQAQYDYQRIKRVIRVIYKNWDSPRVNTRKINELLEAMQIPDQLACVSKETAGFILTRMIKAIAAQMG